MLKTGKQIKRNVVSLISKNGSETSLIKLLAGLVSFFFICLSLPTISLGKNLEIQQGVYLYQMPFTQAIAAKTFIISPISEQDPVKVVISPKPTQSILALPAIFTNPIIVHFQIDSAEITPGERTKLLSKIEEFRIPQNAPLTVTGFTCTMGPAEFNTWLSEERAKAVAGLLDKEGYTVTKIEGKGARDLVSEHHMPSNRRVEITLLQTSSTQTGQSKISTQEDSP